jgi:hypothetical protein
MDLFIMRLLDKTNEEAWLILGIFTSVENAMYTAVLHGHTWGAVAWHQTYYETRQSSGFIREWRGELDNSDLEYVIEKVEADHLFHHAIDLGSPWRAKIDEAKEKNWRERELSMREGSEYGSI